jgi:hypothetical protein
MGYDCTLHLVDEKAIRDEFVPRLLRRSNLTTALDRVMPDADKLWNGVRRALNEDDPKNAASALCQLAVTFSACSLPHQYERGFALCLWDGQEEDVAVDYPSEFAFSPEPLFRAVVDEYARLAGHFPTWFTGNYSTGVFIPAERVPEVLAWVEAQVAPMARGDRRQFKGLLGILRAAADRRLAYWEATDLAVPMVSKYPGDPNLMIADYLGNEPGAPSRQLEEAPLSGNFQSLGCCIIDGWLVSSNSSPFVTNFWNLEAWPVHLLHTQNEFAPKRARSRNGAWLLFSETDPLARPRLFRPRLFSHLGKAPERVLPVVVDGAELSISGGGFVGDQLLVFRDPHHSAKVGDRLPGPLWLEGTDWRPVPGLPEALAIASSLPSFIEKPLVGLVQLADGRDVVIWNGEGYERRETRFEQTFSMQARTSGVDWTYVPAGADGFYYLSQRQLFQVHRNGKPIAHAPQWTNIMSLGAAPAGGILLKEGDNKDGDVAKLYFPAEGTYAHIEPELFDDKDYPFIYWSKTADRFIVLAGKFLAVSTAAVLSLPRYSVSNGEKIIQAVGAATSIPEQTSPPPTKRPWWKFWE